MRKLIAVVLALFAAPAFPATSWYSLTSGSTSFNAPRSVKAVCTTGTEAAPTLATEGMKLFGLRGYQVFAEATTDGQTISGGKLVAYIYDDDGARWIAIPELDITIPAGAAQGYTFLGPSPGIGVPVVAGAWGRIAYVPSGVTISSGTMLVKIAATGMSGEKQ